MTAVSFWILMQKFITVQWDNAFWGDLKLGCNQDYMKCILCISNNTEALLSSFNKTNNMINSYALSLSLSPSAQNVHRAFIVSMFIKIMATLTNERSNKASEWKAEENRREEFRGHTKKQTSTSKRSISTTWQYSISPSVFASQNISLSSISVISHSLYEHSDELPSCTSSPFTQTVLRFKDSIPSSSSSTLLFESLAAVVWVRCELLLLLLPLTIVPVDIEHNVDCDLSIVAGGRRNRIFCFQLFINFCRRNIFVFREKKTPQFVAWK